jgi:hypothetical protein
MDQGIAGVIAGIAGLVGAGVGGLATAYGARIGAQKTIEAAQTQVAHQSAAEHRHWVRDQRREACATFLDRFGAFAMVAVDCASAVEHGRRLDEEHSRQLIDLTRQLIVANAQLQLWGPAPLTACAHELTSAASAFFYHLAEWEDVRTADDAESRRQHQQRCNDLWLAIPHKRNAFMDVSQNVLTTHE